MPLLRPDEYLTSVHALDLPALAASGIKCLLVDIDNTIAVRNAGEVPAATAAWVESARSAGLRICLLSNNWHDHVHRLADDLGVEIVARALKPLPFGFCAASRRLGVATCACAVIGDQIFTDILGGNLVGAKTVLVEPLSSSDLPHTRILRRLEQVIMAGRAPLL